MTEALAKIEVNRLPVPKKYEELQTARTEKMPPGEGEGLKPIGNFIQPDDQNDGKNGNTLSNDEFACTAPYADTDWSVREKHPSSEVMVDNLQVYPQKLVQTGVLIFDMFYEVPTLLWMIPDLIVNQNNTPPELLVIPIKNNAGVGYFDNDFNLMDHRYIKIISRHPHMTAYAGCLCTALWVGNEWRPVHLEDCPGMRYGYYTNANNRWAYSTNANNPPYSQVTTISYYDWTEIHNTASNIIWSLPFKIDYWR